MKCKIECFIAIAFLAGSFYTMTVDKSVFKKFYRMLNRKQKKIYTNIRMERLKIFIKGSLWGMLLSLAFKLAYGDNKNLLTMACTHSLLFSAPYVQHCNLCERKLIENKNQRSISISVKRLGRDLFKIRRRRSLRQ